MSREPELGVDVAAAEVAAEEGSGLVPLFTDLRGNLQENSTDSTVENIVERIKSLTGSFLPGNQGAYRNIDGLSSVMLMC